MKISFEIDFLNIYTSIKDFLLNPQNIILFIKENKEVFQLSSLVVFSLLIKNYIFNKRSRRRDHQKISQVRSGNYYILEGRIICKKPALERKVTITEKISKKNSILIKSVNREVKSFLIKDFIFKDDTGKIEFYADEPKNSIENKINFSNKFRKTDGQFIYTNDIRFSFLKEGEEIYNQISQEERIKHGDIVRMNLYVPDKSMINNNSVLRINISDLANVQSKYQYIMEFSQANLQSFFKFSPFLIFIKYFIYSCSLAGITFLSYKIYKKYFAKRKKSIPALPYGESN